MKSKCIFISVSFFILSFFQISLVYAQQPTQNIKGVVVDRQSEFPLFGAEVVTRVQGQNYWAVTDENGKYYIENVPVGKINIKAFYNGFTPQSHTQISLDVGKELVVNFSLLEKIATLDEVVVKASVKRDNVAFVTASQYGFNVEQTNQYAGSLADVSRMAMNYAGVNGNDDSRNDIIVRGNNPSSLLWVMEGIAIPNPNHYSSSGSSGGPVSMLNINTLNKSDFLSGAFPANFGNTSSAVFDLQFREGNSDKYEFVAQMGFAGLEAGVEGPFSKDSEASFMVNYRYSTVAILDKLGVNLGTGSALPIYQDASFVVNVPTEKIGKFKFWGIGGISTIKFNTSEEGSDNNFFNSEESILTQDNLNGISGLSHKYFFNEKTSSTIAVSYSKIDQRIDMDTLNPADNLYSDYFHENLITSYTTINAKIKTKSNVKNTIEVGTSYTNYGIDFELSVSESYESAIENNTGLFGVYTNWQHRFSDNFVLNSGLRYQSFSLNKQYTIEPRLGLNYKHKDNTSFSISYGLHSNIHPLLSYFTKQETLPNVYSYENTNLDFSKSHHFIVGITTKLLEKLNLKTEFYYQSLFDIPISYKEESYSIINSGYNDEGGAQIFYDALFNEGKGKNYGIDLTLERPLENGFYVLVTASLYDSKYLAKDGVWRNTAWNGKFMSSVLTGKEIVLNPKKSIRIDVNVNYAGGRRFTPINKTASALVGEAVYEYDKAFSQQLPHYFRSDIKLTYKQNGKKISQELQLDLRNVFNIQNVFSQKYDVSTNSIENSYQTSFLPIMQYRILF